MHPLRKRGEAPAHRSGAPPISATCRSAPWSENRDHLARPFAPYDAEATQPLPFGAESLSHIGIVEPIAREAQHRTAAAHLMAAGFAAYSTFSGDPNQLAPIVQASEPWVEASLGKSAFDALPEAKTVRLDEQSRMSVGICDVVSTTFYDNGLRVCSKAARDKTWKADRSPWFLNGREVPRVMFDERAGPSTWSPKYNGLIRFGSAQIVEALVAELLGSYVEAEELLVLTPFRAQRALIRTMLRRDSARQIQVSTVHRSQGSESKIVIFDPVDAGGSFLNSPSGRRLINVAASRAQAHLIIIVNDDDLKNPWIRSMKSRARALWHRAGSWASGWLTVSSPPARAARISSARPRVWCSALA